MNIGIDIDGVLVDIGKFVRRCGGKYFPRKYGLTEVDPSAYHPVDLYGCTLNQEKRFWIKYFFTYWVKEPCMEGCSNVISELSNAGNKIHLITSRAFTFGRGPVHAFLRHLVRKWLKKNDIVYDEIVFCSKNETAAEKLQACRRHGIDVMIDDERDNLLAIRDNIKTICYSSPWNEDLGDKNMIRVDNWSEIYEIVSAMSPEAQTA